MHWFTMKFNSAKLYRTFKDIILQIGSLIVSNKNLQKSSQGK